MTGGKKGINEIWPLMGAGEPDKKIPVMDRELWDKMKAKGAFSVKK